MIYRSLGKSGLRVSALSFGSWLTFSKTIEDNMAEKLMKEAYDNGINFFDNAEGYNNGGSEIVMGEILKKMNWNHDSYIVSSKVFFGIYGKEARPNQKGLSRKHVYEACHAALKRFQLDYLDLYFCHRPDPATPIEETVWAMHQLIMQGKILYWGTSEWSAKEITEAHEVAAKHHLIAPTMEQPQYNMFHRERFEVEYADLFENYGMGTTVWSPLASGLLSGKYNDQFPGGTRMDIKGLEWLKEQALEKEKIEKTKQLSGLAKELNITMSQLALAWCLKNKNVSTAILGATKVEQLAENLGAIAAISKLDEAVMRKIEDILKNKPKGEKGFIDIE